MRRALLIAAAAGVLLLAGCGGGGKDSGGLTAHDRNAAQTVMNRLQNSNISFQLVSISNWVQSTPAACRVHVVNASLLKVYVFWIPWLEAEPYVWLNMSVTNDPRTSSFHLGTSETVLPSGRVSRNGRTVAPGSIDTTLLSLGGPAQAKKGREILKAHAGDVFTKPGASCQVLQNGALRLLPNT
ncbi:MAG: hypothetical protein JOY72_10180 [Actinobacteria bacterium]|nr:hypothetical protein [Actinomycetota bacterium]